MALHATYGFLLDENAIALLPLFPKNRAKTVRDYRLSGRPDTEVVRVAGEEGLIVVTGDAGYIRLFRDVAQSRQRERHLHGLILLGPSSIEEQKRLFPLTSIEKKMRLNGLTLTWRSVSDDNLLVRVDTGGKVKVERLPPCPCLDGESRARLVRLLGPIG